MPKLLNTLVWMANGNQIRKAAVQKRLGFVERVIKEQKEKLFIVRRYIMAKETKNTLLDTIKEIEKTFGKGSVMKLGDRQHIDVSNLVDQGHRFCDKPLGWVAILKALIREIFGPPMKVAAKQLCHYTNLAEYKKRWSGGTLVDAEHSIDPVYARNLGINIEELELPSQPDSGVYQRFTFQFPKTRHCGTQGPQPYPKT